MAVTAYYVDTTSGNDADSGGSGDPWQTIQHALDTVTLPAVIYMTGTDAGGTNISWRAAGSTTPIVIVGGAIDYASRTTLKATSTSLSNYKFVGCDQLNIGVYPFWNSANGQFIDCDMTCVTPGSFIANVGGGSDFLRCTMDFSVINAGDYIGCTLLNGGFISCRSGAVYIGNKLLDGGRIALNAAPSLIAHNSFDGNGASPCIFGYAGSAMSAVRVEHNVFNSSAARLAIAGSPPGLILAHGNVLAGEITMYEAGYESAIADDGTTTIATAYEDANLTPSELLAAIVGSDGLTPGAVQATGSGGAAIHPLGGA